MNQEIIKVVDKPLIPSDKLRAFTKSKIHSVETKTLIGPNSYLNFLKLKVKSFKTNNL